MIWNANNSKIKIDAIVLMNLVPEKVSAVNALNTI